MVEGYSIMVVMCKGKYGRRSCLLLGNTGLLSCASFAFQFLGLNSGIFSADTQWPWLSAAATEF